MRLLPSPKFWRVIIKEKFYNVIIFYTIWNFQKDRVVMFRNFVHSFDIWSAQATFYQLFCSHQKLILTDNFSLIQSSLTISRKSITFPVNLNWLFNSNTNIHLKHLNNNNFLNMRWFCWKINFREVDVWVLYLFRMSRHCRLI